jgi:hypothetical protein
MGRAANSGLGGSDNVGRSALLNYAPCVCRFARQIGSFALGHITDKQGLFLVADKAHAFLSNNWSRIWGWLKERAKT